jgi:hypothetical protein
MRGSRIPLFLCSLCALVTLLIILGDIFHAGCHRISRAGPLVVNLTGKVDDEFSGQFS